MHNKKWNQFNELTGACYLSMAGIGKGKNCWVQTFELLKEIILEERQKNPDYALELEMLDEETDYEYGILDWLSDCLDDVDMHEEYGLLLEMCDDLLTMFNWPEYTGSDVKMRKALALSKLDRKQDAVAFCREWRENEPDNIVAATAGVYALIEVKEFEEAEKLVDKFLVDKTDCSEENDVMFTAASTLYQVMGKKKEKKVVDKAMKEYEKYLKEFFESDGFDEDDFFDGDFLF